MPKTDHARQPQRLLLGSGLVLLGLIILVLLLIEAWGRFFAKSAYRYDDTLGWRPKTSYAMSTTQVDAAGNAYPVDYSTDEFGFRITKKGGNTAVLIVGDSYTADPYVSNDDAYFSILAERTGYSVFPIGGGGYGTLQELELIKPHLGRIKPDLFILQFCSNDFSNNLYALEKMSIVRSQYKLRPYWDPATGQFQYSDDTLYRTLYRYSYAFRRLDSILQTLQFRYFSGYASKDSAATMAKKAEETEKVTLELLRQMVAALPSETAKFSFNCPHRDADSNSRWMKVARSAGIEPLDSVAQSVFDAQGRGEVVLHRDGAHLNPRGHRILGERLAEEILRHRGTEPARTAAPSK